MTTLSKTTQQQHLADIEKIRATLRLVRKTSAFPFVIFHRNPRTGNLTCHHETHSQEIARRYMRTENYVVIHAL